MYRILLPAMLKLYINVHIHVTAWTLTQYLVMYEVFKICCAFYFNLTIKSVEICLSTGKTGRICLFNDRKVETNIMFYFSILKHPPDSCIYSDQCYINFYKCTKNCIQHNLECPTFVPRFSKASTIIYRFIYLLYIARINNIICTPTKKTLFSDFFHINLSLNINEVFLTGVH